MCVLPNDSSTASGVYPQPDIVYSVTP